MSVSIEKYREQAMAIPQAKRQQLLDLLHEGKNLGEAREIVGIDLMVAAEIVCMNISSYEYINETAI